MALIVKPEYFLSNHKTIDDIAAITVEVNRITYDIVLDEPFYFVPQEQERQLFKLKVTYTDRSYIQNVIAINTPELALGQAKSDNTFPGCDRSGEVSDNSGNKLKWCMVGRCGYDNRVFKPYILLTGYRPPIFGQSFRKTWRLYSDEHASLLNRLRADNYDVFLVKFNIHWRPYSHGMQESANLLMTFLEEINVLKGGQESGQENIIQGSSMGSDIARLALLRMEKKHQEDNTYPHHHSRLFIAYDGNFYGANIPLSYQYQIYSHFYYPGAFWSLPRMFLGTFLYATMQQKTVKELLMYHAAAHDDDVMNTPFYHTTNTPTYHWRRQGYYNALDEVDNGVHIFPMPLATRNIAISLGQISKTNDVNNDGFNNAGEYWRNINLGLWQYRIRTAKYMPNNEHTELFRRRRVALLAQINHRVNVNQMQEIDNASGSYLIGTGNIIAVANWAFFPINNIFDGRDYFSHKAVVTALGINKNLWPANGSMTLNMHSLGLMYNSVSNLNNNIKSDHYGYPNLGRPTDHFQVTPFEAIYVDNKINPHIRLNEDNAADLATLNNFVLNEVEPWYLGLQNMQVGAQARADYRYFSYRRARHGIVAGHLVTPATDPGDFNVNANGKLTLKAGDYIVLKPGVHFKAGSIVHIVPEYERCNELKTTAIATETEQENSNQFELTTPFPQKTPQFVLFPNPNSGNFTVKALNGNNIQSLQLRDASGTVLSNVVVSNNFFEYSNMLKPGIYFVQVSGTDGIEILKMIVL